jgi:hypothetical protein
MRNASFSYLGLDMLERADVGLWRCVSAVDLVLSDSGTPTESALQHGNEIEADPLFVRLLESSTAAQDSNTSTAAKTETEIILPSEAPSSLQHPEKL